MWQDALRVCKDYSPNLLADLQDEYDHEMAHNATRCFAGFVDNSVICCLHSFILLN